ncbi:MAG: hypothetical protein L6R39_004366 [Caloplaca ligustica]|nr:MAG: hypothetical protein L6R39_004366 [Caloplaca ligustica]
MLPLESRDVGFEGRGMILALVAIILPAVALVTVIARFVCRHYYARHFGRDDWFMVCSMAFWLSQIFYKCTINPTKISMLELYLRIFPAAQNPRFRLAVRLIMIYVAVYAIVSIIATIVQCVPVARAWDHSVLGQCIDVTAFWYSNAINNILGDILTWGLPAGIIWKLQMSRSDKVGLYGVFALGLL